MVPRDGVKGPLFLQKIHRPIDRMHQKERDADTCQNVVAPPQPKEQVVKRHSGELAQDDHPSVLMPHIV